MCDKEFTLPIQLGYKRRVDHKNNRGKVFGDLYINMNMRYKEFWNGSSLMKVCK